MISIHELIRHLNNGQQADADGVMVAVSRHAVVEAIRLLNLLGETNEALAACQSEGAAWKRLAEESAEIFKQQWRDRLEATEKPWKASLAAAERVDLLTAKPINHDDWYALCNERDALNVRLAEAMRLLAKEGIHMDDHGCWCSPSVTNYGEVCTCHLDDGDWRADCPSHGFQRTTVTVPVAPEAK